MSRPFEGRKSSLPNLYEQINKLIGKNNSDTKKLPSKYIFPKQSYVFCQ